MARRNKREMRFSKDGKGKNEEDRRRRN